MAEPLDPLPYLTAPVHVPVCLFVCLLKEVNISTANKQAGSEEVHGHLISVPVEREWHKLEQATF